MYAIIECGGRQYRAEEGHTFSVEKLPHEVGEQIELDNVLLLSNDGNIVIGQPAVEGATVLATVTNQYRGKKIFVWKYKPKKRYRRRRGHRQSYTRLRIDSIVMGDSDALTAARAKAAEKKAAEDAAAAAKAVEDKAAAEKAATAKAEAAAKAAEEKAAAKAAASAKAAEKKAAAKAAADAKAEADAQAAAAEPEPTIITEVDANDQTLILESDDLVPSDDELGLGDFMDSAAAVSDAPDDATMIVEPSDELVPDELELAGLVADNSANEGTVIAQGPDFEGTIMVEDLTLIEGIGPKTKEALMMANILTFSELAATDADRLKEILKEASISANPSTWSKQASLAAAGDMDALTKYQDELNGGIA